MMVLVIDYYWGRYDAVTYLKYLDTLRVSESFRSVWIFAESSYKIFEYAKKRVYRFVRSDGVKLVRGQGKSVTGKKRKSKGDDKNEEEGECLIVMRTDVYFSALFLLLF
jgi:DNA excision repair protein ERCC-4